jgi:hypothetical protein
MRLTAFSRRSLAAALAAALMVSTASAAMIVPTSFGTGADTMLLNDVQDAGTGPDVVRGNVDFMKARHVLNARVRIPYMRFDLSGIRGDRSGATLSLQLTLNNGNRVRAIDVYGLIDNDINDGWSEATTSYSNAPGFIYVDPDPITPGNQPTNNFTVDPTEMVLLGTITTPAGTGVMSSTTAALNLDAFLASDTNKFITLALVRAPDNNVDFNFATKENAVGALVPTLTLPNALEIPEPTGAAWLALGLAAIGARRSRKSHKSVDWLVTGGTGAPVCLTWR